MSKLHFSILHTSLCEKEDFCVKPGRNRGQSHKIGRPIYNGSERGDVVAPHGGLAKVRT